ncbi:MAG: penicillin-binding protein 2 [bacterium]|nr:penicillin-binding protein 2 [bacterium]
MRKSSVHRTRLLTVKIGLLLSGVLLGARLFHVQIVNAAFYDTLSQNQHQLYEELHATRGTIFVRDHKTGRIYPAVTSEETGFLYADPREVIDPHYAAARISELLGYDVRSNTEKPEVEEVPASLFEGVRESEVQEDDAAPLEPQLHETSTESEETVDYVFFDSLFERLQKNDDPYEPIKRHLSGKQIEAILALQIPGIYVLHEEGRGYPEEQLGGHVFGFVRETDAGEVGQYGIEGYFDEFLSGEDGFLNMPVGAGGTWTQPGTRDFGAAIDGGDLVLTIDRSIQYTACSALKNGIDRYQADGGSLVVLEPETGRVLAMCNGPDFSPSDFASAETVSAYNNTSIFSPYEPGSVFKPIVMAAALDRGIVHKDSLYNDMGEEWVAGHPKPIRNSDLKANGIVTMVEILEKSLNTGMIDVMRRLGGEVMSDYIRRFGFGELTGVELDVEAAGTISSLESGGEIYYATASYGQGITSTVLQLANAYATIANDGIRMKPYIVESRIDSSGGVMETIPEQMGRVLSSSAATTVGAMMVSVVEHGHAGAAGVDGYYIAGKTGTAQVAGSDGRYQDGVTHASFAGYGPIEDPKFVMVIMLDYPKTSPWAADTAAPIFGTVAKDILRILEIPPTR